MPKPSSDDISQRQTDPNTDRPDSTGTADDTTVQALETQLRDYGDRLVQLERQNRHLASIIDTFPQIVWLADAAGTLTFVNQSGYRQTGLSMEDFTEQGFFVAIHPEERSQILSAWQQAIQHQRPFQAEVRLQLADGTYSWYALQTFPLTPDKSSSTAKQASTTYEWVGILSNAQRRIEAETSLHEEQEFLNAVLANLSDGIVACNAEGQLTLFNRATQEFHNLPAEPIPAEDWANYYDLYMADGKTLMKTEDIPLYRALNGESVRDVEMQIVPKHGVPRTVLASGDAITSADGHCLGAVVAMKDISRRKEAEAALQALNAELESRVAERTQELEKSHEELEREIEHRRRVEQRLLEQNQLLLRQNRELEQQRHKIQQQNIQLSEASRMKSRFLATMSHELRTPMNAIIGFSQLLLRQRKSPLSPQMEEMVKRILNNGKKLLSMVNELLDISKAEAGKLDIKPQPCDLEMVITTTIEEVRSLAVQKNLDLQLNVTLTNPHGMNDPVRLRQVVINLVSNAIKFTERGYVRVSVGGSEEGEGDRIVIRVEDTGIGIDPNAIHTIFEPFQQLDQSNTRRYEGTGLGLAIVKSLLSMMQGTITVTSELGRGSLFQVDIPRYICVPDDNS